VNKKNINNKIRSQVETNEYIVLYIYMQNRGDYVYMVVYKTRFFKTNRGGKQVRHSKS